MCYGGRSTISDYGLANHEDTKVTKREWGGGSCWSFGWRGSSSRGPGDCSGELLEVVSLFFQSRDVSREKPALGVAEGSRTNRSAPFCVQNNSRPFLIHPRSDFFLPLPSTVRHFPAHLRERPGRFRNEVAPVFCASPAARRLAFRSGPYRESKSIGPHLDA